MSALVALLSALALLAMPLVLTDRDATREVRGLATALWWVNRFYCGFWHRLEVERADTLPPRGPAILICNHTCCIDHLLVQASTRRMLGFLIAKEYFEYWLFRPFCTLIGCIPVRRDGNDLGATRSALRAIESGRVITIFPEGQILPESGARIGEGKPGAGYLALRAKVPVIPAYLRGTPATNEIVPSLTWPSHVRVSFGPPVDLADLEADSRPEREKLHEATARLMAAIDALRVQSFARDGRPVEPAGEIAPDVERPESGPDALSGDRQAVGRA